MSQNKSASRLMTFVAPNPHKGLIDTLVGVNHWLCLKGIPLLRSLPWLGRLPGFSGLVDVREIDFPEADEQRLAKAVNPATAAFIGPNHPEFFSDWMIDKYLSGRVSRLMASWATHDVVNGMGGAMQSFWLKNNIIAQIPGAGGAAGKAYSVQWAREGHGVLLHPEGHVGWHGDTVAPLFSGIVDLALETARSLAKDAAPRDVYIAPVVWKFRFLKDETASLTKELHYVAKSLGLTLAQPASTLAEQLYALQLALFRETAGKYNIPLNHSLPYGPTFDRVMSAMVARLENALAVQSNAAAQAPVSGTRLETTAYWAYKTRLRQVSRALRALPKDLQKAEHNRAVKRELSLAESLLEFTPVLYPGALLTQEHIAESLKRLRQHFCRGSLKDTLNRFVPRPAGARSVHIRVPEPLRVNGLAKAYNAASGVEQEHLKYALLSQVAQEMQAALDALNEELASQSPFVTYPNPFLEKESR